MATKVGTVKPEDIKLIRINVLNVNIQASKEYIDQPVQVFGVAIKTGYDLALNKKEEGCRLRLYFNFMAEGQENKEIGLQAEISIEYHYKVEKLVSHLDKDDKLELALAASLMHIAYSTSRGIILEKTQSTYFKGIILPVINSTKILINEQ